MLDHIINTLSIVIPAAIISYVFKAEAITTIFAWHPTLMCIGYTIAMAQGIVLLTGQHGLIRFFFGDITRKRKLALHWYCSVIAVLSITLGSLAIVFHKISISKSHFTTWHSWFGVLAILSTASQTVLGILLYFPTLKPIIKSSNLLPDDLKLKRIHRFTGVSTFAVAIITMILSTYSVFVEQKFPWLLSNILIVLFILLGLFVTIRGSRLHVHVVPITKGSAPQTHTPTERV